MVLFRGIDNAFEAGEDDHDDPKEDQINGLPGGSYTIAQALGP